MNFEMQKANLLAENIKGFIKYVNKSHDNKNSTRFTPDKLYQIKLLNEEYRFQILADELIRINQFDWDGKYTYYLVDQFKEGLTIIEEYVNNHYDDLFLLTGRLYTLKSLSQSFSRMV
ncbi:hypothetical protein KW850_23860 [Bacillus sp. sid0103]|uniref:hypothetical protein n=1 Tax=Bacillus sp. sid0103 TaxID=2856337 RepID=UPI001C43A409|nr:hypothetical protein [Bacillus sp. sid0103]MBV7508259.1 hypothetical protein [Bacillus sp. sid0103]